LAGVLAWSPPAAACFAAATPHELDPQEQQLDSSAPGAVEVLAVDIHRGQGPDCSGLGQQSSLSTDDTGTLAIRIAPPADDRTPAESMGYRIELLSGEAPAGLLPDVDIRAFEADRILLHWVDGRRDDQEPLDFSLSIRAIDLGGNLGPRSDAVEARHPGSSGCATAGSAPLWALLIGLALLRRRRPSRA
jgi:hypothetical protein